MPLPLHIILCPLLKRVANLHRKSPACCVLTGAVSSECPSPSPPSHNPYVLLSLPISHPLLPRQGLPVSQKAEWKVLSEAFWIPWLCTAAGLYRAQEGFSPRTGRGPRVICLETATPEGERKANCV